jgi:hypothetical protein
MMKDNSLKKNYFYISFYKHLKIFIKFILKPKSNLQNYFSNSTIYLLLFLIELFTFILFYLFSKTI